MEAAIDYSSKIGHISKIFISMEPKTVNHYLDQLIELPVSEKTEEVKDLISVLQRLKFDFGGNKILRPLVSSVYYRAFRRCLKLD